MCKKLIYLFSLIVLVGLTLAGFAKGADPSLVGWWKLDDGQGTVAVDSSGYGNDGDIMGNPQWIEGVLGGAMDFDGDGDYIDCGGNPMFGDMDEITVSAWLTIRSTTTQWMAAFAKGESAWRLGNVSYDPRFHFGITIWNAPDASSIDGATTVALNEWHHAAGIFDGDSINVYVDGLFDASNNTTEPLGTNALHVFIAENPEARGRYWDGKIDDVRVYNRALTEEELAVVMLGGGDPRIASVPEPANEQIDVCRDVVLSWTPGENAYAHDVYLGTVLEDVEDAERDNDPRGLLVGPEQDSNSYDPPGLLEYGQTYYWRVDEANAPPDTGVHKGEVWSFTTEPLGYPILGENIDATASSFAVGDTEQGPEQTINGSGLVGDLHSKNIDDMWLTAEGAEGPAWIKYEFDKVYKLYEMQVWNYNGPSSLRFLGIKDVAVRYSIDDVNWVTIPDVNEFTQATGSSNYAANTIVPFNGVSAKYVEIDANSNFSGGIFDQYGLSEVRFLYTPARARKPIPASGQADVALDAVLSFRAGREATTHDIYMGNTEQEVMEAAVPTESLSGDSCEIAYAPPSLDLGQRYYWKVVEIDPDSEVWESDIWNFSTIQNFVVDDFESYTDFSPDEIFNTWIDGYDDTSNGSTAGYPDPDFLLLDEHYMETVIVHGGDQSMPFFYDNSGSIAYSEVTRTFTTPQDWTVKDVQMLTMFLRGDPPPFVEVSAGNILMSGIGEDIYQTTDEFNFVYKRLTGDGSITIRIDSIQYTNEWAKAGVMIRSSLEPLAQQVDMVGAPSNRVEWMYRATTGGTTTANDTGIDTIEFPHWVRIRRQGNTFIGEHSTDGVNWTTTTPGDPSSSSTTIQMPNTVYIGLVVTSHVSDETCQAEFSEVSTDGSVSGQWQSVGVGVEQNAGNGAGDLYVVVEDNSGNAETYEHPDNPNAVLIGDWQQWDIPLSVFSDAGLNLRSVKKMTIGVGDRTAPLHGAGLLFVDDIWLFTPLPPLTDGN
jgi:hypothetical protein